MLRAALLLSIVGCLFAQQPQDDPEFNHAYDLYLRGRLQEALQAYQEIVRRDPAFAGGWYELGLVQKDMHRLDEAIDSFKRATKIDPKFQQAWSELGASYVVKEDWDDALGALKTAIGLEGGSKDAMAMANLGYASCQKADLDNGEKYLRAAIRLDPTHTQAYIDLGNLLMKLMKTREGLETLRKGFEIDPTDRRAMDACTKAVGDAGSDRDKAYMGAWQSEVAGKFADAEKALADLIKQDPGDFRAEALQGHVYLHENPSKPNDAITCYVDALDQEAKAKAADRLPVGSMSFLLEGLGIAYTKVSEWKKAEDTFNKGKDLEKDNAWFSYDLAMVMAAQKKESSAIQYLTEALKLDADLADEAKKDPAFDVLKANKEFESLMSRY